jgi:PAS domain S-box-containing protein
MIEDRRFLLWNILLPLVLVAAFGLLARQFGYLVFHVYAETVSIVIGGTTLIVAYTSQRFVQNQYFLLIAAVLGWCMPIDMLHLVTYQGMGLLPIDEQNVSLRLWTSARGLQALGMLAAILLQARRVPLWQVHLALGSGSVLLVAGSLQGWLPVMYVEGLRFSAAKIALDWSIIALHAVTLFVLWRTQSSFSEGIRRYLPAALVTMIAAEILFSLEANLYGPINMLGHLLKVTSYWFLYLTLVYSSLREPFSALASAARIYDAVPAPTLIVDSSGRISQANAAAGRVLGVPAAQIVGKTSHSLFHNTDIDPGDCPLCTALRRGEELDRHELLRRHGASLLRVSIRRIGADRVDRPEFVEVLDDLTAMQRARESQRELESQVEQGAHAAAVMTVLLALAREERLQTTSLERLLETLPGAFRAPSLLRVHLRSPWLTRGREATASGAAVLRWPLDFGAAGQGVLEVHYEDQPGAGGRAFDAAERKLLDETARTLEALGRRTAACTMATGHDQQAGLAGEKTT